MIMDWYTWLSRSGLEPSLVYEYGLTLTRNELQGDDLSHFNHEFLQSMGISVAKHRLEILKLARKDAVRGSPAHGLLRLVSAISKTKRLFTKNFGRWVFHKDSTPQPVSEPSPYRSQWTGALMAKHLVANRGTMRSGPLEMKGKEKFIIASRGLSASGPLDGKIQEKLMRANWSPTISRPIDGRTKGRMVITNGDASLSGPLDGPGLSPKLKSPCNNVKMGVDDEAQSLWSLMFQDMKPT